MIKCCKLCKSIYFWKVLCKSFLNMYSYCVFEQINYANWVICINYYVNFKVRLSYIDRKRCEQDTKIKKIIGLLLFSLLALVLAKPNAM